MRLALNFQRVDPTKGGAETYVADLARWLVREGHSVDLYADSWRARAPCRSEVRLRPRRGRRLDASRAGSGASPSIPSEALRSADRYDCTVGFINTWHHDVIIPQGGVHEASRQANAQRFAPGLGRGLYRLSKRANPRAFLYGAIEDRQYDPARRAYVVAVSEMVRGHLERFHRVPRERIRVIPNAIDADRLAVDDPAAVRSRSRRAGMGLAEERPDVALFLAHNLPIEGALAPSEGAGEEDRAGSLAPDPPARLRGRQGGPLPEGDPRPRPRKDRPPPRLPARCTRRLPRRRFLRPADVLRPLLARRLRGARLRPAGHHDRLQRRGRADRE